MEGLGKWKAENSVYKCQTRKRRMSMCGEEPAPREHGKGRNPDWKNEWVKSRMFLLEVRDEENEDTPARSQVLSGQDFH